MRAGARAGAVVRSGFAVDGFLQIFQAELGAVQAPDSCSGDGDVADDLGVQRSGEYEGWVGFDLLNLKSNLKADLNDSEVSRGRRYHDSKCRDAGQDQSGAECDIDVESFECEAGGVAVDEPLEEGIDGDGEDGGGTFEGVQSDRALSEQSQDFSGERFRDHWQQPKNLGGGFDEPVGPDHVDDHHDRDTGGCGGSQQGSALVVFRHGWCEQDTQPEQGED